MTEAKKLEVLSRLYNAMEGIFTNTCHGVYEVSNDNKELRQVLKRAEELELKWSDFYSLHKEIAEQGRQKCISKLEEKGLENLVFQKTDKGYKLYNLELDSNTSLKKAYEILLEKEKSKIREGQIVEKFSGDKKIVSEDYSKVKDYFHDNIMF